jgi:hypothetical protein
VEQIGMRAARQRDGESLYDRASAAMRAAGQSSAERVTSL